MSLFNQLKSKLTQAAAQVGQAGSEALVEMQLDRVRRWIEQRPPEVTDTDIINALQQIVAVDSRISPEAHRLLAEQLAAKDDVTNAIQHLQAAVDFMESDVPVTTREWIAIHLEMTDDNYLCDLYNDLAALYQRREQWQQALATAEKAIRTSDRDLTAHHTCALCLLKMGQEEKAYRMLQRARTFDAHGLVDMWIEEFQREGLLESE